VNAQWSDPGGQLAPWAQPAPGTFPGWGMAPAAPAPTAARQRVHWAGTVAVAAVVAAVVLGGLFVDAAVPLPSAGTVTISGPVTMTAAQGWTLTTAAGEVSDGIALQRASALLIAQVVDTSWSGDDASLLREAEKSFAADGGFRFGDSRRVTLGGHQVSEAAFSALVSSAGSSGVIDGELLCMVLRSGSNAYAVLLQVGVPQGMLSSITADADAMAASVGFSR
jgi:hypothetical protein